MNVTKEHPTDTAGLRQLLQEMTPDDKQTLDLSRCIRKALVWAPPRYMHAMILTLLQGCPSCQVHGYTLSLALGVCGSEEQEVLLEALLDRAEEVDLKNQLTLYQVVGWPEAPLVGLLRRGMMYPNAPTLLATCVRRGLENATQLLLEQKANPNEPNVQANELPIATYYSSFEQLIQAPRLGVHRPGQTNTLLHAAAAFNHAQIVRVLVAAGADLEAVGAECLRTPLFYSIRAASMHPPPLRTFVMCLPQRINDSTRVLLELGANAWACDRDGCLPLQYVCNDQEFREWRETMHTDMLAQLRAVLELVPEDVLPLIVQYLLPTRQ